MTFPTVPFAVPFDYPTWVLRFPMFAGISEPLATLYFNEASGFCANNACNPYFASGMLGTLLNLLTAHIAWLNAPRDDQGNPATTGVAPSTLVGRINTASEGSVSVGTENQYPPGTPQWYQMTQWGAEYWALTAATRTMRYAAQPTFVPNSIYPYAGRFGFGRFR